MDERWYVPGALPGGPKVAHLMAHGGTDPRYRSARCGAERSRVWKPVDLRTSPPGFFAFLGGTDPDAFEHRDPFTDPQGRNYAVREFLAHLKTVQQAKPTTIKSYHAALDHFYGYHLTLGRPVADRERVPRWAPRALKPPERKKFLRATERCPSIRDTAIAATLYFSGARISELAALDTGDVVRSARRAKLIVRDGKGGIYRTVPGLHLLARTALDAWLTDRAAWLPEDSTERALFVGRRGQRLGTRRIDDIVDAIAVDAGIAAGPHDLRHTLGTMLREQGYDLAVIAEILGHASVETTGQSWPAKTRPPTPWRTSPSRSDTPSRRRARLPIGPG